jgi:lipopolysaccharide/colanic/teichoic acid biosynthesis glycosyltransferase
LNEALVDRNRLANVRVGAAITVTDNFILGNFVENKIGQGLRSIVSRLVAAVLLVLLSPLLLLTWLARAVAGSRPAVRHKEAVRLPHEAADFVTYRLLTFCSSPGRHAAAGGAHEFFLHFLPGLINAARGHLSFVGVAPRDAQEIERLPRDWRRLYLSSSGGLITESYVVNGPGAHEDQVYTAEVFYTATAGPRHDLGLIGGYLTRVLGLKRRENALESTSELEQ